MDDRQAYEPIAVALIPKDIQGNCSVNLYVYLPTQKKFILFVPAGEKFSPSRKVALDRHIVPALFIKTGESALDYVVAAQNTTKVEESGYEALGAAGAEKLKGIFQKLTSSEPASEAAVAELKNASEEIIQIVAPDVGDLKIRILQNAENVWVMNDSSAIITIGVLFAAANGFDSPKPLRDLVYASLVMDLPLIALGPDMIDKIYLGSPDVSIAMMERYHNHPLEAYRIAKQSLRYFTETSLQLILNHHEYKNGMGWPRKVRTETLFPMAKVLSAAVDTFEKLKRSQLKGESVSLLDAVKSLLEPEVEIHSRRHNKEIVDKVLEFMGQQAQSETLKKAA